MPRSVPTAHPVERNIPLLHYGDFTDTGIILHFHANDIDTAGQTIRSDYHVMPPGRLPPLMQRHYIPAGNIMQADGNMPVHPDLIGNDGDRIKRIGIGRMQCGNGREIR